MSNRLGPVAELWSVIEEIVDTTAAAGIEVESIGAEAPPGQVELNLRQCDAAEMADRHMLSKFVVQQIARRRGLIATFMARPTGSYGGSCHFHAGLWNAADRTPADAHLFDAFGARAWYRIDTILSMAMTLRLTEDEQVALRDRAQAEGISMQEAARRAVREYVTRADHRVRVGEAAQRIMQSHADALRRLGE